MEAMTPPRSMSPTSTTGTLARVAKPILAMSRGRRLISAGEPAPSTMTRSAPSPTLAQESSTASMSFGFSKLIVARPSLAIDLALHHDLAADVALRLQQHGVHVDRRRSAAGDGLQPLRPADLAAAGLARNVGDGGIVRHVLRLERPDDHAALSGGAAKAGDQHGLADIRAGALEHDGARHLSEAPAATYP